MELKLNIYNATGIEKTYSVQDFRLKTGVCEDILEIVEIDKFATLGGKQITEDAALEMLPMMMKLSKQYKPIMMQIFPDLTEEEYKNTDMKEVSGIAWNIIMYTMGALFNISEKN